MLSGAVGAAQFWSGEWGALPVTRTSAFPQYGDRDGGLSASVYRKKKMVLVESINSYIS